MGARAGTAKPGKPGYIDAWLAGKYCRNAEVAGCALAGDILFRIVDGIFQNGFTAKRPELPFPSYESNNFKENKLYSDGVILIRNEINLPRILFSFTTLNKFWVAE